MIRTDLRMRIDFLKNEEATCEINALRADGVLLRVPTFDKKFPLPHDLAHYVVETELACKFGFWGCIAKGVLFPGMTALSGRQPIRARERSNSVLKEAGQSGTEAEVMVGVMVKILHEELYSDPALALAKVSSEWRPARPTIKFPTGAENQRICELLRKQESNWHALKPGDCLSVHWRERNFKS